jgi:hypothetical protein
MEKVEHNKPYLATITNNKGNIHSFRKGEKVEFISFSNGWYKFRSIQNGITQNVKEEHFDWD